MKISICIPQYNRIQFLLKSLQIIESQQYANLEIVISDDCSTDDTELKVKELIPVYKFPIVYHRNDVNRGYDWNFRKCVELASGEYVMVLGNDDTLNPQFNIGDIASFLEENSLPELGFTNYIEESSDNALVERAKRTAVLGSGYPIAIHYYSCFSFVGGLMYKKSAFEKYNTSKHDGSIYAQIYLGCLMIASGCRLFSFTDPYVIRDIVIDNAKRNSYKDVIARKWKDYKIETGGLPSVINVVIEALSDAKVITQRLIFFMFKRIYSITFPFWIIDYKSNGALPAAVGLISGLKPTRNRNFNRLNFFNKMRIWCIYCFCSVAALLTPVGLFKKLKGFLYRTMKK